MKNDTLIYFHLYHYALDLDRNYVLADVFCLKQNNIDSLFRQCYCVLFFEFTSART